MAKPPAKISGAEKDNERQSNRLPVNEVLPISLYVTADDIDVESRKLNEIRELLWLPKSDSEAERNARIIRAVDLYESLEPADGAESMLATQMVGTHYAALECLRRASHSEQSFEGRDMGLKHAQKLMTLYAKQLETLNKHRGKGQQRVTVEHVNIAPGGQAIVGNVDTGGRIADSVPASIDHSPEVPIARAQPAKKAKSKMPRE